MMTNRKPDPYNSSFGGGAEEQGTLADRRDNFYWLGQMNKASLVLNTERGLLAKKYAQPFVEGLQKVLEAGNSGGPRPQNVVAFEPEWIGQAGPEVSRIHAGRSSQDMLTTANMAELREDLLTLSNRLTQVLQVLGQQVEQHEDTVVPAYTNGVAAQPTSYAHYLLGFAAAFARDQERLQAFYAHVNRSPLGSTVLNGTGWPLDRERLAAYLGFPELAYNCFDATQIYTLEVSAEAAGVCQVIAVHVGNFIADLMQQYAQPRPWILLQEGESTTYVSSAMPQKRNPGLINNTRSKASTLIGDCTGAVVRAHNVPTGMTDTRGVHLNRIVREAAELLTDFHAVLQALRVDASRALEELNLDWTAAQEVADELMREYDIPFRIGHHVVSEMVGYARQHGIHPLDFPHAEAERIYQACVRESGLAEELPRDFPLDEAAFRETLDPVHIVQRRAVLGGPQKSELAVMQNQLAETVQGGKSWRERQKAAIAAAAAQLEKDFQALCQA